MENTEITKETYHNIMKNYDTNNLNDNGFVKMIKNSMIKSFENFMSLEIKPIDSPKLRQVETKYNKNLIYNLTQIETIHQICDEVKKYVQTGDISVINFDAEISDEYIQKLNKMPQLLNEQILISHTLFIFKILRDLHNGKNII